MTYNFDEVRERIPLYLNGRLSKKEKKKFEESLNQYPELKAELREFSEIKGTYKEIEEDISLPSDPLFQRVLENVRPQRHSLAPLKNPFAEKILEVLKWFFHSPRLSWGIVAVQLAIIFLLLVALPRGDGFKTLTSRPPLPGEGIKINVIFDEGAREKEIREVLNGIGATIVHGPSLEGLYVIEVKANQDAGTVLKRLKEGRIVKFAEEAY